MSRQVMFGKFFFTKIGASLSPKLIDRFNSWVNHLQVGPVVLVPLDGRREALLEPDLGLPAELGGLLRAERVAAVVAGTVLDVLDQRLVAAGQLAGSCARRRCSGSSSGPPML